jgi:hydrogenase maturation protease
VKAPVLVIGVGNPGRGDDGLGPAVADALEGDARPGLTVESAFQLSLEHAADVAAHRCVLFVDAVAAGDGPCELRPLAAAGGVEAGAAWSTHVMPPEAVLAVCGVAFGRTPQAWLLAVRGYDFEPGRGLSEAARANLAPSLAAARRLVAAALAPEEER